MMDLHVIPECYIDTKLCKILAPPATRYNHQKGCPAVVKVMKEKLGNDFALGIVDKDKVGLAYFNEFELISELPDNIQLFKKQHHYLIFIRPTMEKWLIHSAENSGVSLVDFNLPHDFRELAKITKTSKSENEDPHSADFKNLFIELKRANSLFVRVLSFWIEYLKQTNYNADMEFLCSKTIEMKEL